MTFKEFLQKTEAITAGGWSHGHRKEDFRRLAESVGAKFDPEPVELPVLSLQTIRWSPSPGLFCQGLYPKPERRPSFAGGDKTFTDFEAIEIVRRCNTWPELLRLYRAGCVYDIAKILEGSK